MDNKNLTELSERELENKEKLSKNAFYFIAAVGLITTLIVVASAYMSGQPLNWVTLLFTTVFPLFYLYKIRKDWSAIKAEFERRRLR